LREHEILHQLFVELEFRRRGLDGEKLLWQKSAECIRLLRPSIKLLVASEQDVPNLAMVAQQNLGLLERIHEHLD
jgi:hypothetical protein